MRRKTESTVTINLSVDVLNFAMNLSPEKEKTARITLRDCDISSQQNRVLVQCPSYERAVSIQKNLGFEIFDQYKKRVHYEFKDWMNKPLCAKAQQTMLDNLNPPKKSDEVYQVRILTNEEMGYPQWHKDADKFTIDDRLAMVDHINGMDEKKRADYRLYLKNMFGITA
jgi:hypothetical protein